MYVKVSRIIWSSEESKQSCDPLSSNESEMTGFINVSHEINSGICSSSSISILTSDSHD